MTVVGACLLQAWGRKRCTNAVVFERLFEQLASTHGWYRDVHYTTLALRLLRVLDLATAPSGASRVQDAGNGAARRV
jgi:hypothetical protein